MTILHWSFGMPSVSSHVDDGLSQVFTVAVHRERHYAGSPAGDCISLSSVIPSKLDGSRVQSRV